ncbi:hypothetical protein HU200_017018 [Digitaria exilis]|uniref:beta-galactosidase n=1 Tax=Digitaria exilis TaxID=1010633 RepID=A0A835F7B4_9POAL|nr:hypothetical protein HU200_017018 [Digitaria exilis]
MASRHTLCLLLVLAAAGAAGASTVAYDDRALVIDGQRRIILSGAIHYPRSKPEYNFEGNYDIVRFFREIHNAGMYAILRIGPYVCAEWNHGGLPAWLRDIPGMQFRLHNEPFEREMETFTTLIVNKMKEASMFAGQGGPIILAQVIENEYGDIMAQLNNNRSASQYIHWCADMANKQKCHDYATSIRMVLIISITVEPTLAAPPVARTSQPATTTMLLWMSMPKYGHLKNLHNVLLSMETTLVHGEYNESSYGENITIKTPASVMVMRPSTAEEPEALNWSWMPENLRPFMTDDLGSFRKNQLLEQISTSSDQSDYLWYMTSLEHKGEGSYTLYVNTTGHELYAFVNGEIVGQKHSTNRDYVFQLESPAKLHSGKNYISLLSGTVGLTNYGALFELVPAGIVGGPVKLVGANGTAIDLTENSWSYVTGLDGEHRQICLDMPGNNWRGRNEGIVPVNRPFTWYKTSFDAPAGEEAVVVDLLGLNKGAAWVNGNSLGRYWPSYAAAEMDGCHVCDYRREFNAAGDESDLQCLTGCGEPSQRFYHVPRSFLRRDGEPNTLILFEEAGGDPTRAAFRTVAMATTVCASRGEHDVIAGVNVARGSCGAYEGGWES